MRALPAGICYTYYRLRSTEIPRLRLGRLCMRETITAGGKCSRNRDHAGARSESGQNEARLLKAILTRRPLLREVVFMPSDEASAAVPPPACLGAPLCFLDKEEQPGAAAFVLPVAGPAAITVAVLHALAAAADEFHQQVTTASRDEGIPFETGNYVQLSPEGWVYLFDGTEELGRRYIRLRVPNGDGRSDFIGVEEAFRLHRVDGPGRVPRKRERPSEAGPTALARLLKAARKANIARLPNQVLLLSSRRAVAEFVESVHVSAPGDSEGGASLREVLTWGRITSKGELVSEDKRTGGRPPVVAVTHSIDCLAAAARAAAERPRAVVIDGASKITNLQAMDDVVARHRVVIISEHGEEDILRNLADRGVMVWYMEPDELLLGTPSTEMRERRDPIFGRLIGGARNARDLNLRAYEVEGGALDMAANALVRAELEGKE